MTSPPSQPGDGADYMMGHSDHELARLKLQATLLAPITRRLLDRAGLKPGMRVLDIGCGTGEGTFMAADIVGDAGAAVGIDRSEAAVRTATARARPNLRFEVADVGQLAGREVFDVAFCRYVVMHQPRPAEFLRAVASVLRPGGVLAVHEIVLLDGFPTAPRSPLWDRANEWFIGAFRARLPQHDVASRLVGCFAEAGLGVPELFSESLVGPAATSPVTSWFVETLRTLSADIERLFGVSPGDLAIDTLADRLRADGQRNGTQVFSSRQVCAWARV